MYELRTREKKIVESIAKDRHIDNINTITDILEVMKEYGRVNHSVWLFNATTRKKIDMRYDHTRRYFVSNELYRYEDKRTHRVNFEEYVKFICDYTNKGYYLCF